MLTKRSPSRILLGLGLVGALGCRAESGAVPTTTDPSAASETGEIRAPMPPADVRFASRGVPHSAAITGLALSPEGDAALSRDASGGLRLWASLDGSSEPLVVPIRDPKLMALARRGDGSLTLALGDAAGGVRIIGVDAKGEMQKLGSLSPTDPIADLTVLPGGEQILAVGQDHVLRLLDRTGQTLARLDEPGLRIHALRVATHAGPSSDELAIVALTAGEADPEVHRLKFEALTIEVGEAKLERGKWTQSFHSDTLPTPDNPTLSPDGRALVFINQDVPGAANCKVFAMQLEDGRRVSVFTQLSSGVVPRLTLLAGGRALIDDSSGIGRVVDFASRSVTLRSLRSGPLLNPLAGAARPGLRVAPAGTWLAVHELDEDQISYLGYEPMTVTYAGLAPAAEHVAWAVDNRVLVEDPRDPQRGEAVSVPGTELRNHRLAEFLDPDHLILVEWNGGVELVDWRSGEVIDSADLGSDVQQANFARAADASGVLVARTNLWANPALLEFRKGQIGAGYMAQAPANHAGPLLGARDALDSWGMWTIDGAGKLRELDLGTLAAGLDHETELELGTALSQGMPEQFAKASDGTSYWIRTMGTAPELHVEPRTGKSETFTLAPGFVVMLLPSPDNSRLAVVQQRDPNRILTVYDMHELEPAWAQPVSMVNAMTWSDDSEAIALATTLGGGAVLDGSKGTPITARCGLAFQRRHTPPRMTGGGNLMPNMCEL